MHQRRLPETLKGFKGFGSATGKSFWPDGGMERESKQGADFSKDGADVRW